MSYKINNIKNATHGFFISAGTSIAEPSTILPLIIQHFGGGPVLIGLFTSLLRGGAIVVQLFAAFYAQSYNKVMPYMRVVFFFRFLTWFLIGVAIFAIGDSNNTLMLWLLGFGLFAFSFSAGFGSIYFKEIIAKVFVKSKRAKTMANRQLFSSVGAIISGGVAGWILDKYDAPSSYAYLFMISAFVMAIGFFAMGSIDEPVKEKISKREDSFLKFLQNAKNILHADKRLQLQITAALLGYSYLFAMPFVIIDAKQSVDLTGWVLGGFITIQMIGAILGNLFVWKRFSSNYGYMLLLAYILMVIAFVVALNVSSQLGYAFIFFLFGFSMDGFRNADMNLILEIAPEDKRPVYVALQSTIVSLGLFFSIPGGFILSGYGYTVLYLFTIAMLLLGIYFVSRLIKQIKVDSTSSS